MSALLMRVIIAVVCVLLLFALLPPVARIFGLDLTGDVLLVLRICIGGIAFLYVLAGSSPSWPWKSAP
jgi:hypothetical protein